MTDQPRLRRALRSLAGDGARGGDPAAVVARAASLRRRRMAYAGAGAVSVAAVLGVAVAVATTTPRDASFVSQLPSVSPQPTDVPSPSPELTPPSSPTPSMTATAPASAPPSPSPSPEPSSPAPTGTYAPAAARVHVTVVPAETGERSEIRVRVTDPDGWWHSGTVDFGDGRVERIQSVLPPCPAGSPAPANQSPGEDRTATFTHAFRTGGTHTVSVVAHTSGSYCPAAGESPDETVTGSATFQVPGEDLAPNGPAAPAVTTLERRGARGPYNVWVEAEARDPDGTIVGMTYDWGDGSAPLREEISAGCRHSPDTGYPSGDAQGTYGHTYAPGTYTLTVTVRSAGCDGSTVQEGSATLEITVA